MITVEDFKTYFKRYNIPFLPDDLPEGEDVNDYITDDDIEHAIGEMFVMLPEHLFDEVTLRLAQLYLTAHCLVNDMRTARAGLISQFPFPLQSRSVGSVSESYGIPSRFLDNPLYSFYITSQFGLKYLAMLLPRLIGNVSIAYGATTP